MSETNPTYSGGEGAAVPAKPKRTRKPAKARRKPEAAVLLVVTPDGSFRPANEASRLICKTRKLHAGLCVVAYLYLERNLKQWATAHGLGSALAEHVEGFEGMNSHAVLKKLQADGLIAVESETFDLGTLGKVTRSVPISLAFDELDESRFQEIYGQMIEYVRKTYWGTLDEAGMLGLQKLLGMGA